MGVSHDDRTRSARHRTLFLVAGQLVVLAVITLVGVHGAPAPGLRLPAIALAPLFTVSGMLVFHLEFRQEAHSFTLAELPLVLGLFLASPGDLLVARLLGEMAALLFHARQPPLKIVVNMANALTECAVALFVFHALFHGASVTRPTGWIATFAAVVTADLVSVCCISAVIRWHGGDPNTKPVAVAAIASASANASLGIVAAIVMNVHVAALLIVGVVAAVLFAAFRGYAALAERYASLQVLHEFTQSIGGALRPADVIEAMLHHACKLLRADVAELVVLDETGDLRIRLEGDRPLTRSATTKDERKALSSLAGTGVILKPRGLTDPDPFAAYTSTLDRDDFLLVALDVPGAQCAFAVAGRLAEVSTFDDEDSRLFSTLANHAAMALGKGQLIEQLRLEARRREHQALHDDLTGLPNRPHFHEACAEALVKAGGDAPVSVLLMDLDLFKEINDTLGHHIGDKLLIEVSRRISAAIRTGDVAARLGGDEFAILLTSITTAADVEAAAAWILDAAHAPIAIDGIELEIRASVGAAVAPDHGTDPHILLQHADVAMYAAKRANGGIRLYSPDVDHHSPRRLQIATELRRVIRDDELTAYFQPKADLASGRIVGVEALVRWHHQTLGPIFPDEFIPIAEQTGLVTPLTMLVLRQALSACATWHRQGHDIGIAVNIATRSLLEPHFFADIAGLITKAGLAPRRLTLEITESGIMSDTRRALDVLNQFAELGVRLSVDDFGTGYSSLSYLQELPVHELKVDKSFVFRVHDDQSSRSIVRSIVDLGHSLGLTVVAEGVENQLAWDHLLEAGCDIGQGYFLSRPIPVDELTEWLHRSASRSMAAAAVNELVASAP